ncbi:hypothetical protein [Arthrobacter sp. EPSL27]|uniref:hypothetical protein n=1 Tax=Arthrobacter sp. EPSL27 TaxID=1745378 RepID=UPI000747F74A|nr:hypothetical protein [Arthrobacter sp. EPSL27]KUM33787.1 hypothetical protein AR539_18030 [Arthrobacter sp. EPSL27]
MSGHAGAARTAPMSGHTRISTQALSSVAKAAAAEALGVAPHDVRADWSDDDGLLALSLVAPITVPPLATVLRDAGRVAGSGGSIWDRAVAAKAEILDRVTQLSGARLSRVDIRIGGASMKEGARVH